MVSASTAQTSGSTGFQHNGPLEETHSSILNTIGNSFEFMTQPPNVLLPSSPEKILSIQKTGPILRTQCMPCEIRNPICSSQESPIRLEIDFTSQSQAKSKIKPKPKTQPRQQIETKNESQDDGKALRRAACTSHNNKLDTTDLVQHIPPEAFRGLFYPDDELAMIMERKHPAIKDYLAQRTALRNKNTLSQSESNVGGAKRPLLERDSSAEQIIWTSQSGISSQSLANHTSTGNKPKRRNRWSEEEIEILIQGYKRHGPNWHRILNAYPLVFRGRTNVDLKDKARHLAKSGLLSM